jgi:YD repeat-containing protein
MKAIRSPVLGRALALTATAFLMTLLSSSAPGATTTYDYDALGRLRVVTHDNRIATTYTLDPAGNRTQVTDVSTGPTSAPASISVPSSSATGDYAIAWGAATGMVLTYELYESTSPSFSASTRVHSAASRSSSFAGKPNNTTYYYRVRACANSDCSAFTAGGSGVTISIVPPGAPSSITIPPSSSTGNYSVVWSEASGSAQIYELYESFESSFASATLVQSGASMSRSFAGKAHGSTYYYRVRACGRGGCGSFTAGASGVTTTIPPPSAPPSIFVAGTASVGNYIVSWGASSGTPVTAYELYESPNASFSPQTLKYSDTGTVGAFPVLANGTLYYRVRACGSTGCSGYTEGANPVVISIPPPAPAAPTNLSMTFIANCAWRANWSAVSDAANYVVRDTVGTEQTVTTNQAHVPCPFNNQNANKPKWVKACGSNGRCSTTVSFP